MTKKPKLDLVNTRRAAELIGVTYQTMANKVAAGLLTVFHYEGTNGRKYVLLYRDEVLRHKRARELRVATETKVKTLLA
jgi:hypothetical protein